MTKDGKVRWGVISTANIGVKKVLPGILKSEHSHLAAIASRDLAAAKSVADKFGIPKAYGSYEEMLADPDIDAVYNPLPNHLHVPLTIAAARAGKHVLCEKPIGLDAADAEKLRECPKDILVTEAFMVRYHPQWHRARDIIRSGELGTVKLVRSVFLYNLTDPTNVRNRADIGGGGIMDIGCYSVVGSRFLFEAEPRRVVALVDRDPEMKIDRLASVIADFGEGRQLVFNSGTQSVNHQSIEAIGNKGRVEIVVPYNAPETEKTSILIDDGARPDKTLARREILPLTDQYAAQAEAFALAVLGQGELAYGIEDAILNMKILDAIFKSEKTGGWVDV